MLVEAREGKEIIKQDLGMDIDNDNKRKKDLDILNKAKLPLRRFLQNF